VLWKDTNVSDVHATSIFREVYICAFHYVFILLTSCTECIKTCCSDIAHANLKKEIQCLSHPKEEFRLTEFENRALRRKFGPKRDEVTGGWRRLHNEELQNLYGSPNLLG
jgi:hypothetical protein